jgi:hypothetical protein
LARLVATETIGIPGSRVLRRIDGLAAADADHRVVRTVAQLLAQLERGLDAAARHREHVGPIESGAYQVDDPLALTGAHDHRHVATRRDVTVGEDDAEARDRAPPHVDRERCRHHAG